MFNSFKINAGLHYTDKDKWQGRAELLNGHSWFRLVVLWPCRRVRSRMSEKNLSIGGWSQRVVGDVRCNAENPLVNHVAHIYRPIAGIPAHYQDQSQGPVSVTRKRVSAWKFLAWYRRFGSICKNCFSIFSTRRQTRGWPLQWRLEVRRWVSLGLQTGHCYSCSAIRITGGGRNLKSQSSRALGQLEQLWKQPPKWWENVRNARTCLLVWTCHFTLCFYLQPTADLETTIPARHGATTPSPATPLWKLEMKQLTLNWTLFKTFLNVQNGWSI